jgi:Holliday junction resolvase
MASSPRIKGFTHERELARRLWKEGFAVVRAPASGAKTKRVIYPDITAIYKRTVLVIEVKVFSKPRDVYIEERKIRRLVEFADRAGGKALVAIKFIGSGEWRLVDVKGLELTPSGYYRIPKSLIYGGIKLEELIEKVKKGLEF